MAERDGAPVHVQPLGIQASQGLRAAQFFLSELSRGERALISQNLRCKGFVHLDEFDVFERQSRLIEQLARGENRT